MPRLVIAEKPSVARDLSRVLGASSRQNGFLQGNGWLVTWCIGHLVELCEPHEYNPNWKRWSLPTLPMIPHQFQLRPVSRTQSHFNIVQRLLRRRDVSEVINACDAGREGELIFRYVYALSNVDKPMSRLWISSMTDRAIRDGFDNLRPGHEYDALWDAARCRSEADWLIGLNATRAMTLRTREAVGPGRDSPLLSVGRVQTPCLSMLVQRELAIRNFVPEDYWQLQGQFGAEAGEYKGRWFRLIDDPDDESGKKKKRHNRLEQREDAEALFQRLQGQEGVVVKVDKRRVTERPPLLFDLTRLQRTANKRFGFSAARTLELAQALYEKHKLLTYPRTDSAYLSTDMIPKMRPTISAVCQPPFAPFAEWLLEREQIPSPRRVFNNAKVSDHHAIIPTDREPRLDRLSRDEARLYELVTRRFLAAFFPDAVFEKTTVVTEVDGESFLTRGRVVIERAWREVIGLPDHAGASRRPQRQGQSDQSDSDDTDDEAHGVLPPLNEGDPVSLLDLELQEKQTRPPPRYTEATLLAAMEGAGRQLEEEELQQALKDCGLGTPATRASIIETLIRRRFVDRRGKSMVPTEQGIHLICSIPVESLKSPELTGEWEARMARIARREESVEAFQTQVCQYLNETINAIKGASIDSLAAYVQDNPPDAPGSGGSNGSSGKGKGKGKSTRGKSSGKSTRSKSTKSKSTTSKSGRSTSTSKSTKTKSTSRTKKATSTKSTTKKTTSTTTKRATSSSKSATSRSSTSRSASGASSGASSGSAGRATSSGRSSRSTASQSNGVEARSSWRAQEHPQRSSRTNGGPPSHGHGQLPGHDEHQGDRPRSEPRPPSAPREAYKQLQQNLGPCPRCGQGLIIWGKSAWGCDQWRQGCRTTIPYVVDGYELSVSDALALLKGHEVGPINSLKSQDGEAYTGTLSLHHSNDSTFLKNESSE